MRGGAPAARVSVLLAPVLAIAVAVAVGHVLIIAYGETPARVFETMLGGTWGSAYGVGQVLFKATPLLLTGIAVAIPFRVGMFNIGAEGQVTLGALATALTGLSLPPETPWVIGVPVAAGAGFVAGAAWGAFPGWLKVRFGAHEVITTMMLNFVALSLANYLVVELFRVPESVHTEAVVEGARIARLAEYWAPLKGSAVNTGFMVALAVAGAAAWWLFRTPGGFEARVVGLNPRAAEAAGIDSARVSVLAMGLAGGCAGLVGMNFVQGYKYYFEDGFAGGVGFMGIAVAILGRNHPLWVIPAALLFGTLSQGGLAINALVPKEVVEVIQAVIIIAVVASTGAVRAAEEG